MEVLLVAAASDERERVTDRLEEAGHTVHLCGGDGDGCGALDREAEECPLDHRPVDAAVLIPDPCRFGGRRRAQSADEVGALCAVRRAVPLVVTGDEPSAFDMVAAVTGADTDSIAGDLDRARTAPVPIYGLIARDALRQSLRIRGLPDDGADVSVTRAGRGLRIRLHPTVELDRATAQAVSIRVHAALRTADAEVVSIAVSY